jgi:pyruvate/2-oxoglutarate dehydrogenase complex dihydrolipoamide dehydrogenase (E3) component
MVLATTKRERPESLAVIGAGPIGCKLGQAFHHLGSQVTIGFALGIKGLFIGNTPYE